MNSALDYEYLDTWAQHLEVSGLLRKAMAAAKS
jgi:hypothetical protein